MKTTKTMKLPHLLGAAFGLLLVSASSSHAAAVIVQNFSFESPGGNSGDFPSATSWVGSTFTEISADVGLTGGDGDRYGGQNSGDTMTQDLGVTFLADTTYTLTVALGNRNSAPQSGDISGAARFGLTNGGAELGTFTLVDVPTAVPGGTFQDFTYTFTTGAVAPTGNVGISLGAPGPNRGVFDNVRLDATLIPEPSAALLGGLGIMTLLVRRRRA